MKLRSKNVLLVAVLLMAALVMAACGNKSDSPGTTPPATPDPADSGTIHSGADFAALEAAAIAEGELNYYAGASLKDLEALVAAFSAKYPQIKVNLHRHNPSVLNERLLMDEARNQPVADVVTHSDNAAFDALREQGIITAYTPESASNFPAELTDYAPYGWPDRLNIVVLEYNTENLTADEIALLEQDGFAALADPRFKDRIGSTDPNILGTAYTFYWTMKQQMGAEAYEQWLHGLKANNIKFFDSNVPAADAVAAGEIDVTVIVEQFVSQGIAKGAPVSAIYPSQTPAYYALTGVTSKAPNPNAARLFVEWFLGVEGQTTWQNSYQVAVPNPDVDDQRAITQAESWKPFAEADYYLVDDFVEQSEGREEFMEEFNTILGIF